jgi:hypothetical protein
MKLTLKRKPSTDTATIGDLSIDGIFFCYTLERPEVQIATGIYDIELTYSPRFNRPLPLLDSVPGRTDIRIHSGNWPRDTEGCLLVGYQVGSNMILQSRAALDDLIPKIQAALDAHDDVSISIS